MMTSSKRYKSFSVFCMHVLGFLLCTEMHDATAAPPDIPQKFDVITVQHLIANIDQDNNAVIIQFGYFATRRDESYPVKDGYALLKVTRDAEPIGTKRWFLLQSVCGFAGLHISLDTREEGFDAYDSVFQNADRAKKAGANDTVMRSIYEFASLLSGNYGIKHYGFGKANIMLAEALKVYLHLQESHGEPQYYINWTPAVAALSDPEPVVTEIKALNVDPTVKKDSKFFRAIAEVDAVTNPVQAVFLLKKSHPGPNATLVQQQVYYDELVSLLVSQGQVKEAVIQQQAEVKATGQGQVELALLYRLTNNEQSYDAIVSSFSAPGGSAQDINNLSAKLVEMYEDNRTKNASAAAQAINLLSGYLSTKSPRDQEQDYLARLTLVRVYTDLDKPTLRLSVLEGAVSPKPGASNRTIGLYASIDRYIRRFTPKQENPSATTTLDKKHE